MINLHNLDDFQLMFRFSEHTHPITALTHFSFGLREIIISGDRDGTLFVCDLNGRGVLRFDKQNPAQIKNIKIITVGRNYYASFLFEDHAELYLLSFSKQYKTIKGSYSNFLLAEPTH